MISDVMIVLYILRIKVLLDMIGANSRLHTYVLMALSTVVTVHSCGRFHIMFILFHRCCFNQMQFYFSLADCVLYICIWLC